MLQKMLPTYHTLSFTLWLHVQHGISIILYFNEVVACACEIPYITTTSFVFTFTLNTCAQAMFTQCCPLREHAIERFPSIIMRCHKRVKSGIGSAFKIYCFS